MLKVHQIEFSYQKKSKILNNLSFGLQPGEHLCVMGESGSGKSTLLKAIYGLLDLDSGSIFWKDQEVLGPAHHLVPGMDFFKYVPQNFDLMPYTTVEENIQKFLSRFYPEESKKRSDELLQVIEMEGFAKVKVKNLSGGQQQRVAIARALANEPELILLDEPFSQIDNFKKNSLRRKLFSYLKEKNIACIVATHDGSDALSFADQMLVIQNNKILSKGKPQDLYKSRAEHYIASLFDDVNRIEIDSKSFLCYPSDIRIVSHSNHPSVVKKAYFKGTYWLIEVVFKDSSVFVQSSNSYQSGELLYLDFSSLKNETISL